MNNWRDFTAFVIGAVLVTVVVCSPVACTMHKNQAKAAAIVAGADPLETSCAMDTQPQKLVCETLARAKAKE